MNRKDLNPDASPQAAFGARLRRVREEKGWPQEDLGGRMEYSGTHVSAVETGRKLPTLRFARRADTALETGNSFEQEWREMRQGSLLEGFPEYLEYEARAVEIRLYEVGVVPGLLQTSEYAATLEADAVRRAAATQAQADERVALVEERQASLARSPAPLLFVVLDESCIRRPMGPPRVMAAQLARLLDIAEQPNTLLQVAPFAMGARRPFTLPITILTMRDRALMAYAESAQRGHLDREIPSVVPTLTAYHHLQAESLTRAESVAMIEDVRKGMQ
ncbi:Scr1 family TA system antitoxin-like transcriptional regulator [Streptomyces sp. NPDC059247]|uniref:helix-turn-helix domain-containing protein n=1 Tax=Streptomyces sp. NPDC059247 TaxID=3346790 RepID=UPI0036B0A1BD